MPLISSEALKHQWAFISNHPGLDEFHLIRVRNRLTSEVILRHQFNGRSLIFCPPGMDSILLALQKGNLKQEHARIVQKLVVKIVQHPSSYISWSGENDREKCCSICIESIILHEARKQQYSRTRSGGARVARLISEWKLLRENWMKQEQYLQFNFVEDVARSLAELKRIIEML